MQNWRRDVNSGFNFIPSKFIHFLNFRLFAHYHKQTLEMDGFLMTSNAYITSFIGIENGKVIFLNRFQHSLQHNRIRLFFSSGYFLWIYCINRIKHNHLKSRWTAAFSTFKSHSWTLELIANVRDALRHQTDQPRSLSITIVWVKPDVAEALSKDQTHLALQMIIMMFVRPWLHRQCTAFSPLHRSTSALRRNKPAAVLSDTRERRCYSSWLISGNLPGRSSQI